MKRIIYIVIFITGITVGATGMYLLTPHQTQNVKDNITTTQLEGEKIKHKDWSFTGKTVSFKTESEGVGVVETEVKKSVIPEAYNWMYRKNILQEEIGIEWNINHFNRIYSLSYYRRWNRLAFGGGIIGGSDNVGIKAGVMFLW